MLCRKQSRTRDITFILFSILVRVVEYNTLLGDLWDKFLKTENRYGYHVFAESCARSYTTFSPIEVFFLQRSFECFSSLIPYTSEPRKNTVSMVSQMVQAFCMLHFSLKWRQNFFVLVFWAKKRNKMSELFPICSWYFSELIIDTEIILLQSTTKMWASFFTSFFASFFNQSFRHEVWRLRVSAKNTLHLSFNKNSWSGARSKVQMVLGPGIYTYRGTFWRPLNASARNQARHAVALIFFNSHELTKIVLQNFKGPNGITWPRERNYNSCSFSA